MRDKKLLFSKHEFVIAAATAGMKELYGFDLKGDELEKEDALYILQSLCSRGYAEANDSKFILKGFLKEAFDVISGAKTIIEITKNTGKKGIIYIDEMSVFVSPSIVKPDILEVDLLKTEIIFQTLTDEGWIESATDKLSEVFEWY